MKTIVIGAGPSGLIASYFIAKEGLEVILIEQNEEIGKKIHITGKGRCNLTNNCDLKTFINNINTNPSFLFSSFSNWSSQDTINLFEENGVELVTERGNRVFPKSYNAKDVTHCLNNLINKVGVNLHLNEKVISICKEEEYFIVKTNKTTYKSDNVILSTGGISYPYTGSKGDGYKFAKLLGHDIVELKPGLCALQIKESIPSNLYKFTLKNVTLNIKIKNQKSISEFGELTFYKEGLAGPICLTVSSLINRISPNDISISLDLKPSLDFNKLDKRILRELLDKSNKTLYDILKKLMPKEFIDFFLSISNLNKDLTTNNFSKENRELLVKYIKELPFSYIGLENIEHAIITCGGVNVKQINPKTMESKLVPNLYFVGEIIDVDAFTGGFNMQIAFATGFTAAKSVNEKANCFNIAKEFQKA